MRIFRRRTSWVLVSEAQLIDRLTAGGKTLDQEQRSAMHALVRAETPAVYLWGDVGRGKTWMAENFYALVDRPKCRFHLHQFLAELHSAVTRKRESFDAALSALLGEAQLLYLDEFVLHDVADAHLIRRTVAAALASGRRLLMTSNYPPDGLLPNPLYHHHAIPLIEQLNTRAAVVRMGEGTDYRTTAAAATGFASGQWVVEPPPTRHEPGRRGQAGRRDQPRRRVRLTSRQADAGRALMAYASPDLLLEVDFAQLCEEPLSAADYAHLAAQFTQVRLRDVPHPERLDEEAMQRFAFLVDVLVSADIRLDVVSAAEMAAWHQAKNLPRDGDRMLSRLQLLKPQGRRNRLSARVRLSPRLDAADQAD